MIPISEILCFYKATLNPILLSILILRLNISAYIVVFLVTVGTSKGGPRLGGLAWIENNGVILLKYGYVHNVSLLWDLFTDNIDSLFCDMGPLRKGRENGTELYLLEPFQYHYHVLSFENFVWISRKANFCYSLDFLFWNTGFTSDVYDKYFVNCRKSYIFHPPFNSEPKFEYFEMSSKINFFQKAFWTQH